MGLRLGLGLLNRWDIGRGGGEFLGLFHVENAFLQFGRDLVGVGVGGDIDFLFESKPLAVAELPFAGDSQFPGGRYLNFQLVASETFGREKDKINFYGR